MSDRCAAWSRWSGSSGSAASNAGQSRSPTTPWRWASRFHRSARRAKVRTTSPLSAPSPSSVLERSTSRPNGASRASSTRVRRSSPSDTIDIINRSTWPATEPFSRGVTWPRAATPAAASDGGDRAAVRAGRREEHGDAIGDDAAFEQGDDAAGDLAHLLVVVGTRHHGGGALGRPVLGCVHVGVHEARHVRCHGQLGVARRGGHHDDARRTRDERLQHRDVGRVELLGDDERRAVRWRGRRRAPTGRGDVGRRCGRSRPSRADPWRNSRSRTVVTTCTTAVALARPAASEASAAAGSPGRVNTPTSVPAARTIASWVAGWSAHVANAAGRVRGSASTCCTTARTATSGAMRRVPSSGAAISLARRRVPPISAPHEPPFNGSARRSPSTVALSGATTRTSRSGSPSCRCRMASPTAAAIGRPGAVQRTSAIYT